MSSINYSINCMAKSSLGMNKPGLHTINDRNYRSNIMFEVVMVLSISFPL